jgi:chromosomal replication initiation ATPase DnaA
MRRQNKEAFDLYLSAVSEKMGITKSLILSKNLDRDVTAARHMLWKLCKNRPMRVATIQKFMLEYGHKVSHTAIINAIRRMEKKFVDDVNYEVMFESLQ